MVRSNNSIKEEGVVFLEFLLVFALFAVFFVVLFDVTRFFTTQIVLTHAAQRGLTRAVSATALEYDPEPERVGALELMQAERKEIVEEVVAFPKVALDWIADLRPGIEFHRFSHYAQGVTAKDKPEQLPALVLLPGESAEEFWVVGKDDVNENNSQDISEGNKIKPPVRQKSRWEDYPLLCSRESESCESPRRSSKEVLEHHLKTTLRVYPIIVKVRTKFLFTLPFLKPVTVTGQAIGYREKYPLIELPAAQIISPETVDEENS